MRVSNLGIYTLLLTGTALAQAESKEKIETDTLGEPVIVTGVRASLTSALGIKREKLEIVDSIVAEDINKLPDFSVGEAIQRVTGVQIARDRGEVGPIAIRGLSQVETTLNGREIFTAGSGRSLDFADIPSELIAGIDVYKTSAAEQLEGGIGGLVDLRTRRPFDFREAQRVLSVRQVQGSLIDKDKTQLSTLLSDRWKTSGLGEFGALFSFSHQERAWREDQKSTGNPTVRTNLIPGRSIVVPNGTTETTSLGERKRTGASLALQWQPIQNLELYAEGSYVELRTRQDSHQINVSPSTTFVPGSVNLFPGTNDLRSITWTNAPVSILSFARDTVDRTRQFAVGGVWSLRALTLKADLSHTQSHNDLYFAGPVLSGTAGTFTQYLSSRTPNTAIGGTDLSDPANLQIASVAYRRRPFDGSLTALKLDSDYQLAGGFVDTLSAGLRLSRRRADNGSGLIFGDTAVSGLSAADRPGYFMANPYGNFFPGSTSIGNYLIGNLADARNADSLRAALGLTGSLPSTGNPLSVWNIEEETSAAYVMATLGGQGLPLDGNVGVRLVHTATSVSGNQTSGSGSTPIETQTATTDVLPSINLRYQASPGLYLRAAASKTITRPNFDQLSPSLTLLPNTVTPSLNRGFAGNPALRPIRADNLDLAVERYFSRHTSVYLTGFIKQVDGFVTNVSNPEVHGGQTYQVNRPQNANPADIKGLEIGYQQFYDFLPGWLSGFGLQANYTYVDSETPDANLGKNMPLQNLSKHSANLVGMYEKGRLSARLAYNWRDKYLSGVTNVVGVGALPVYTRAYGWLDAALGYRISDQLSIALEGLNLTGTTRSSYYGVPTRPQSSWRNDTQIAATMTVRF